MDRKSKRKPLESGVTLAVAAFIASRAFWGCLVVLPLSLWAWAASEGEPAALAFTGGVWRTLFSSAATLALVRIYERLCDRAPAELGTQGAESGESCDQKR